MMAYINRDNVCYQLEKQASQDSQPRAIRRAARIVASFPAADVVERKAVIEAMMNASTPAFDADGKPTFLVDYVKVMKVL